MKIHKFNLITLFLIASLMSALPVSASGKIGRAFTDKTFGTKIIQVTNEKDGKSCVNSYSYWPSFNMNDSKFFITCDGKPILYKFNTKDFTIASKAPLFTNLPDGLALNSEDALWSDKSPNIIFARANIAIWAYDTEKHSASLVKDLSEELPGKIIFQMSKSTDDNRFAFTLRDPSNDYKVSGYAVYDRKLDRIIYQKETTSLDEVQIDKSGEYLVVKTGQEEAGQVRIEIIDLATKKETPLTAGAPDFAPGHSDNGYRTMLGYDNWNNEYTLTSLIDPISKKVILDLGKDWTQASHVSFLATGDKKALVSFYANGTPGKSKYAGEIVLVRTDGSGKIKHILKHNSVYREYYDTPRASMSRDGKWGIFTSNWGSSTRRDVYIFKLPKF
jgi:hypothetical protein